MKIPRNNKKYVAAENSRENFGQIKSAIIKITALVNVLKFFRAISSKPVVLTCKAVRNFPIASSQSSYKILMIDL